MTEEVQIDGAMAWVRVKPYIEDALEYCQGTHTIEDIEKGISDGKYTLWVGHKSAAITEIHVFPRARFFHLFLGGGDLEEIKGMVPIWQAFAAHNGCSRVTLCGRRGWERAFRDLGWKADMVCLSAPATPETLQ